LAQAFPQRFLAIEQPEIFNDAVVRFLRDVEGEADPSTI
jgi:hypothetical protein